MGTDSYAQKQLTTDIETLLAGAKGDTFDRPRPSSTFVDRLPKPAAASLLAFDELVVSGKMPSLRRLSLENDWDYGFDFAGNECQVWEEGKDIAKDVFALGEDGDGNKYVLRVDGRVYVWNHEQYALETHTMFSSLDALLYTAVQIEALDRGTLTRDVVEKNLRALGDPGALFLAERLD